MSGKVAAVGVGTTQFGKLPGWSAEDLGIWALDNALADCGLARGDIDGLIVNRIPDYQRFCQMTGLDPRFVNVTPGQGRMSGATIQIAAMAIASGMCETIALVYGNNGRTGGVKYGGATDRYGATAGGEWFPYGMTSPGAVHALMFDRHRHEYGTSQEQLAHVAVTFREHAALNPDAVMRERISEADYHASRYICEPLHLFDYCLINDGGVAIILTSAERARDLAKPPVHISAFSQATALPDSAFPPDDFWREPMGLIARDIREMSGIGPSDLSGTMIYDNFSPTVLFTLEGFGFCDVGESGAYVADGNLARGAALPTNTSGGHMSESYMQGWALNVEAIRQLRHECGERQIAGAETIQYMCAAPLLSAIIYSR
ncbi:lipid-transfer protein [Rhodobacteraceae bacterium WD3A24]|nr:lipid-transfer protein [Rhodobacteraceae bacterium WD3A24]